jgi:hypothetical protein
MRSSMRVSSFSPSLRYISGYYELFSNLVLVGAQKSVNTAYDRITRGAKLDSNLDRAALAPHIAQLAIAARRSYIPAPS